MGGPTTTPKNVNAKVPPVAMLAMPGGARRATSARYTPFQPMAEAPKPTKITITTAWGVSVGVLLMEEGGWGWLGVLLVNPG